MDYSTLFEGRTMYKLLGMIFEVYGAQKSRQVDVVEAIQQVGHKNRGGHYFLGTGTVIYCCNKCCCQFIFSMINGAIKFFLDSFL